MDTIFARATAQGKAGVAIIRVSGPQARHVAGVMAGGCPDPRRTVLRKISAADGEIIDEGLIIFFEAGSSFTGEDVLELQVHGSQAVTRKIEKELSLIPGLRPAEAGEFTRRALENNNLDLTQVEGLAELIDAETEVQRKQARLLFSGALAEVVSAWRSDLLNAMALLEATIDFVDEDVPIDVIPDVKEILRRVRSSIESEINGISFAERVREGFQVVIAGQPNSGKSTLLNYLARRDVAITSDIPGTTRDRLEVRVDLDGLPVTLIDTAGLRETSDTIEALGIERSWDALRNADMCIYLLLDNECRPSIDVDGEVFFRMGKDDDGSKSGVSGRTGFGVNELLNDIRASLENSVARISNATLERHRYVLSSALCSLRAADLKLSKSYAELELVAEDLRVTSVFLGEVVGVVGIEDVLGQVFSRFCIGK